MFQCPDLAGIQGWHWEVAVTYADILADVCVHGITSRIQKLALLGSNRDTREVEKLATSARWPMRSAGLVDLAYFHSVVEVTDGGTSDVGSLRYVCLCTLYLVMVKT